MKRFLITSLSVLLSTVALVPFANANETVAPAETSNQLTQPKPQADQTDKSNEKQLANRSNDQANGAQTQLSERDRLVQQYHLQQIIPAQE